VIASRGMGDINPSKMPGAKEKARRDNTDFAEYKKGGLAKQAATAIAMKAAGKKPKKMAAGGELKEVPESNTGLSKLPTEVRNKMGYMKDGGKTKSKVNAAGNYTKPELRKRIFNAVKAEATAGTGAGQWSARKAQMVAQRYKKAGGGYRD
jgi:hypothetical protein